MGKLYILAFLIFVSSISSFPRTLHAQINSCKYTPYPQICNSSITNLNDILPSLQVSNNLEFRDMSLKITLDHAQKVHKLISSMDFNSLEKLAKVAWEDCLELYEDTIHQLSQTILFSNDFISLDDIQTYLSAASTNHETCQMGFADLNISMNANLVFSLNLTNFSQLLTNALAINGALLTTSYKPPTWKHGGIGIGIGTGSGSGSGSSNGNGNGRRLLANGFPSWISNDNRRLLQTSMATTKADLIVAQDGSGNYKTITEAIVAANHQRKGTQRFIIYVKSGFYKESVVVTNKMINLMLIGDGIDATIVSGSKSVYDGFTTFRTATFTVGGDGFIAKGITFQNTAGPQKHQAVALRSASDFAIFYRCSFKGYQDTLYIFSKRQFYKECDIYGTVDTIFGNAAVILQNCNIYARKPMSYQKNTVTAQGRTDPNQNTGIVIHNSIVEATTDLKATQGSIPSFLGRPWMKYSRTVVMKSSIDGSINSAGWEPWDGSFALDTLYFGEYMNSGAGANTKGRVNWTGYHVITNPIEAGKFTVENFLDGEEWISSSGVPFTAGL